MASLAAILRRKLQMLKEDALAVASTVESAFQGRDEVSDDALDKDLRQLFYDLQDEKILDVRRQEFTQDGRLLRGYYWHIREEAAELPKHVAEFDPTEKLYRRLPEQAWEHKVRAR
jgi:hypothetical protein